MSDDHVVMEPPLGLKCLHCGEVFQMRSPVRIGVFTAAAKAFIDAHKNCKKT